MLQYLNESTVKEIDATVSRLAQGFKFEAFNM